MYRKINFDIYSFVITRAIDVNKADLPAKGTVTERLISINVEHALVELDPFNLSGKNENSFHLNFHICFYISQYQP